MKGGVFLPGEQPGVKVWTDEDEWSVSSALTAHGRKLLMRKDWKKIGDPILHIEVIQAAESLWRSILTDSFDDGQIWSWWHPVRPTCWPR